MPFSTLQSTSPMVVVANRLPFILARDPDTGKLVRKICAGGLVTAVAPVVIDTEGIWVGWPGMHLEDQFEAIPESEPGDKSASAGLKSEQIIPVNVSKKLFLDYYNGCCNACFWPLFHSMPDRALFQADKWEAYRQMNEIFANLTMEAVQKLKAKNPHAVPLIWLHDYHLMLAANYIRHSCNEEGIRIKMAFFLHIPFPSWDIVRLFPWADELLQGILGCDSIGFHVEDYCFNFIDCCHRRLGCRVDRQQMLIAVANRTVAVHPLPISIPYDRFQKLAEEAPSVVKSGSNEHLILGVDRLDYTKGIVHRLKAFELLLEKYPVHKEKVTLFQVAVPSRTDVKEYQDLKEELDQLIGRINGRFSTPNWSPIRYIFGCISQDQLAGFYRDASVALVTPLRDGMNLVAKEFVACQTKEPGVLLLSPFAGAGTTMHEALLVNPYETNEFADVLHRALTMPKDERELRMQQLRRREKERDVIFWLRSFLKTVDCLADENLEHTYMRPITEDYFSEALSDYVNESSKLALILDYDGTLAPLTPHPDLAIMPEETKRVLYRLARMPDVNVAVISGRSLENVKKMVNIEGITYAGSHGLEILHPDESMFVYPVPQEYETQVANLKNLLSNTVRDGAWLENKGKTLIFHYMDVSSEIQPEMRREVEEAFREVDLEIHQSKMTYEARPDVQWNKGRAAIHILRTLFGVDWSDRVSVIFAGDDSTDEDAMVALQGMAVTFRITDSLTQRTAATYRLPNTDAVLTLLRWIDRRLGARGPVMKSRTPSFSRFPESNSPPVPSSPQRKLSKHKLISNMVFNDIDYQNLINKKMSPDQSPTRDSISERLIPHV